MYELLAIWLATMSQQTAKKSANMISAIGRRPGHRRAHRCAEDRLLRDRRVAHALRAESLEQPDRRLEHAARTADILTEEDHVRVAFHLLRDRASNRVAIGQFRHDEPPSDHTSRISMSSPGGGEALASTVAVSTSPSAVSSIASSAESRDTVTEQARAIQIDRVVGRPRRDLILRLVRARIGARVPARPIGSRLDERRAAAAARAVETLASGEVHRVGVVAVDEDALQPVRRSAIRRRALDRGDRPDRRVFHVQVVLADEHHRELPDGREVQRLVERADVGGAVTEERDCDTLLAAVLRRPGGAERDGQMGADDRVRPHDAVTDVGEVHRPALPGQHAARASEELAHDAGHRRSTRQSVRMAAICRERVVVFVHRLAERRCDGFLTEREVARALDEVLHEQVVRARLELAHPHHLAVERELPSAGRRFHPGDAGSTGRHPVVRRRSTGSSVDADMCVVSSPCDCDPASTCW